MTNRAISLWLDAAMLTFFVAIMSWRFTGVPIHEWGATALLAIIVVHLIIHWHWVATRVSRFRTSSNRTRINVVLNFLLFVLMGVALASGYAISKAMIPNSLTASDYVRWHSVHETSSTLTLIVLGLHVAVNWDLIANGIRRVLHPRPTYHGQRVGRPSAHLPFTSRILKPLGAIVVASVVVAGASVAVKAVVPEEKVQYRFANGTTRLGEAPPDIKKIHSGDDRPSSRGSPKVVLEIILLTGITLAGRKILRLRL